jgi:hypothetical protein
VDVDGPACCCCCDGDGDDDDDDDDDRGLLKDDDISNVESLLGGD